MLPAAFLIASFAAAAEPALAPASAPAPAATPAAAAPTIPRTLDIPNGALVAPGPAPEVDLLYTGDVIGYIEPCG
jgi:hypothetical protein